MLTLGSAEHKERDRLRAQPGPRARHGLARPRPARLQLPALGPRVRDRPRPARAARRHARRPRARGRLYREALAELDGAGSGCRARTTAATAAAGSSSSSSSRTGSTATTRSRALRERGVQTQAVPARHPPDVLLPRALRPPRGRVPGLRGRRRALGRAAVLPGDDRGAGRARSPRRSAACWAESTDHRPLRRWPVPFGSLATSSQNSAAGARHAGAEVERAQAVRELRPVGEALLDAPRTRRAGGAGPRPARARARAPARGPMSSAKNSLSRPRSRYSIGLVTGSASHSPERSRPGVGDRVEAAPAAALLLRLLEQAGLGEPRGLGVELRVREGPEVADAQLHEALEVVRASTARARR